MPLELTREYLPCSPGLTVQLVIPCPDNRSE